MTNSPNSVQDNDFSEEQVILGVDTHNDIHVAAVITTLGVLLGTKSFRTTTAGYSQLLDWARSHGLLRGASVEGTSSHGTALTRHLRGNGVHIIEVNRPDRAVRRRRGKTDHIDAENAARAILSGPSHRRGQDRRWLRRRWPAVRRARQCGSVPCWDPCIPDRPSSHMWISWAPRA